MKKYLSLGLCFLLLVSLASVFTACGEQNDNGTGGGNAGKAPAANEEYFKWNESYAYGLTDAGLKQKEITVPAKAAAINTAMFNDAENLTKIYFEGDTIEFRNNATLERNETITFVQLPAQLQEIPDGFFYDCSSLQEVVMPSGLVRIGERAFSNCLALTTLTNFAQVETIGESAFFNCKALDNVTIPAGTKTIETEAFHQCQGLTNLTFAGGEEIGLRAFYGCISLTRVELPETLITLENAAFSSCGSLTEVRFPASLINMGGSTFEFCPLETVEVKEGSVAADAVQNMVDVEIVYY